MAVSAHSLAALFGVLTGMPLRPRIGPASARRLVRENVERPAQIVPLSVSDYRAALDTATELGSSGGVIFDALIARAAAKVQAEHLLTLNPKDFRRVWPERVDRIISP